MRKLICIALSIACLTGLTAMAQERVVLKAGEWVVTYDTHFSGSMYGETMDPVTESTRETECWTTEEQLSIAAEFFESDECSISGVEYTPFGMTGDISCLFDKFIMSGPLLAEANTARDMFGGRMVLDYQDSDMDMKGLTVFQGYWAGECEAPAEDIGGNNN